MPLRQASCETMQAMGLLQCLRDNLLCFGAALLLADEALMLLCQAIGALPDMPLPNEAVHQLLQGVHDYEM